MDDSIHVTLPTASAPHEHGPLGEIFRRQRIDRNRKSGKIDKITLDGQSQGQKQIILKRDKDFTISLFWDKILAFYCFFFYKCFLAFFDIISKLLINPAGHLTVT